MDPFSIFGVASSAFSIASQITTSINQLDSLRDKYDSADFTLVLLTGRLSSVRYALNSIATWTTSSLEVSACSEQLNDALNISLNGCNVLVQCLDQHIRELCIANGRMGILEKGKYLWKENTMKEYLGHLDGEIKALDLLLTSYQCRTLSEQRQMLQLENSRKIMTQVTEDTASLKTRAASRSLEATSTSTSESVRLEQAFGFDDEVVNSQVYRKSLADLRARERRVSSATNTPSPTMPRTSIVSEAPQLDKSLPDLPTPLTNTSKRNSRTRSFWKTRVVSSPAELEPRIGESVPGLPRRETISSIQSQHVDLFRRSQTFEHKGQNVKVGNEGPGELKSPGAIRSALQGLLQRGTSREGGTTISRGRNRPTPVDARNGSRVESPVGLAISGPVMSENSLGWN